MSDIDAPRHAELFYLQKQIQSRPMSSSSKTASSRGCIEWYDATRSSPWQTKNLIYKSAIKYMYKLGDIGQ